MTPDPAKLQTWLGPIEASALRVQITRSVVPAGDLRTTSYFFCDTLVRVDQHLDVSQAALEAAGLSQL